MADLGQLNDEELMKLITEGNHNAFAVLVQRYTSKFYRLAYRFTNNKEDAEDIVQDSFIKLWERPDMWQPEQKVKFTTWFYRVIVNRCLDAKKKHNPLPMHEDYDVADERVKQDEVMILSQEQKALEREISSLPKNQRAALNLCFYEGLSNQEAADVMQMSLKALQSLIMRAKTTLKNNLKVYS